MYEIGMRADEAGCDEQPPLISRNRVQNILSFELNTLTNFCEPEKKNEKKRNPHSDTENRMEWMSN